MNRLLLIGLLVALLLPAAVAAQKLPASDPPKTYRVGSERVPLYRSPADTARAASTSLAPNETATVVGRYSPRWLVVKRTGFLFLAASEQLIDPDAQVPNLQPRLADGTLLPLDEQTHRVTYEGVVEVPGATQNQLYDRALEWMAKTYQSANDVVQIKDKEQGKLLAKGGILFFSHGTPMGFVVHTQTIYVKDGRYKYLMTGFKHQNILTNGPVARDGSMGALEQSTPPEGFRDKLWFEMLAGTNAKVKAMIADLEQAMQAKGKDPSKF
ncbi:DUF4468 domain-containing protein [Microvirga sp. STS02]|uniref:DUF4468 domain-containing protein n=1 Tax=Hymenobacter negativus TaxID=2795026 RepID=UPI0018DE6DB8|nr:MULTISPECIES: DUF4468 domain-containing protein [Bacteria]MBH8567888.1 DUF4468 domain-containing protein [Hymenobacter negativus]MBR7207624.1 DUF4468 domain-containing protein [Microvirga sp. STS02]